MVRLACEAKSFQRKFINAFRMLSLSGKVGLFSRVVNLAGHCLRVAPSQPEILEINLDSCEVIEKFLPVTKKRRRILETFRIIGWICLSVVFLLQVSLVSFHRCEIHCPHFSFSHCLTLHSDQLKIKILYFFLPKRTERRRRGPQGRTGAPRGGCSRAVTTGIRTFN